MKNLLAIILCTFLINLNGQNYDLAIQDVNIFNSKTKTVEKNKTILINEDRIAKIIPSNENFKAKKTIEGRGRLVSPGFIDTHVHTNQMYAIGNGVSPANIDLKDVKLMQRLLALQQLRYGTTSLIDMGLPETWLNEIITWQKNQVEDSPNIYFCGSSTISDEERTPAQHHNEVMNPDDARAKVKRYDEMGFKYMKLYSRLRKPEMEVMVDEAAKRDIILNAHTDYGNVTIQEAMDMGVRNFEHFFTVTPSIIDYDVHWGQMQRKFEIETEGIDDFTAVMSFFFAYIDEIPEFKLQLEELFDQMAKNGASISTTIHVLGAAAGKTDFFTNFQHFPIRKEANLTNYGPEEHEKLSAAFDVMMSYLKMAYDKGVKIRIGTDCRYGGKAFISELMLLRNAGFTTAEVLEIATINGYEAMNLDDDWGSIEKGKVADLVIFNEDPFVNVANFKSEKIVIKNGKVMSVKNSIAYEMLDTIVEKGYWAGLNFYEAVKDEENYLHNPEEMNKIAFDLIGTGMLDEAIMIFEMNDSNFRIEKLELPPDVLNNMGYEFVSQGKHDEALQCFILNTKINPEEWNVWDSLGETYMNMGLKTLAIKYYEKSMELNPENSFGKEALEKLKVK